MEKSSQRCAAWGHAAYNRSRNEIGSSLWTLCEPFRLNCRGSSALAKAWSDFQSPHTIRQQRQGPSWLDGLVQRSLFFANCLSDDVNGHIPKASYSIAFKTAGKSHGRGRTYEKDD
jgi:hypothetical protein